MEPRFIVGPPGTGKTYKWIVKKYKELLAICGSPDFIICTLTYKRSCSTTLNAIMKLKDGITLEDKNMTMIFLKIVYVLFITIVNRNFYTEKLLTKRIPNILKN